MQLVYGRVGPRYGFSVCVVNPLHYAIPLPVKYFLKVKRNGRREKVCERDKGTSPLSTLEIQSGRLRMKLHLPKKTYEWLMST